MIFNVLIAILILSVVIIVHEFGHFIIAKANGVCVVEFSVGFGPRIFSFRIGDTDYCLKALPFGGSCRMLGQDEYLTDTAKDEEEDESGEEYELSPFEKRNKEMLEKYGESRTLEKKSVSARIAVLAAGPVFNFLFAVIASIVLIGASGYDPCVINEVETGSPGYEAGLRAGDEIVGLNGNAVHFAREYGFYRNYHESDTMDITYKRDGVNYKTTVVPEEIKDNSYKIGIKFDQDLRISEIVKDSPAGKSGLREQDKIVAINGDQIESMEKLSGVIDASEGKTLNVRVSRAAGEREFQVTPEMMETSYYYTGLTLYGRRTMASPIETIGLAFCDTGYRISSVVEVLGMMLTGRMGVNNLSGPVGTVSAISTVVEESKQDGGFYVFLNIINIAIMLSANLGVVNLLPVPALDGGKLIVYVIEAIRGRPAPRKVETVINFIGVIFLLVLMAFVLVKDIVYLF